MSRPPNTQLTLLLEAAGWGPVQLAHAMRTEASEQGRQIACHPATVRRWLAGTQPRPPMPSLLLQCLSRRLGRAVTAQEAGLTRAPAAVVDPTWEAEPVRRLTHLTRAELDPARRALLGSGVYALTALTLPEAPLGHDRAGPAAARPEWAEAERTRAVVTMFAAAAEQHGGRPVRACVAAYLAHDVVPRLHAPGPEPVHRDLLSAAAQLTLLLASLCADDGHDAATQHYQQIAARLAADANDEATLAIALRAMATHAHELGHRTTTVLHLAERASDHARHAPYAVQAYTQAQLALVQAPHDPRAARAALSRAETLHARADTGPGPFTAYPLGALHYQRAAILAALGDHSQAARALATSLRHRTPGERLPAALTRARLAETQLHLGHLDQAVAHWQLFLEACPTLESARITARLHTMRTLLRPYRGRSRTADLLARSCAL